MLLEHPAVVEAGVFGRPDAGVGRGRHRGRRRARPGRSPELRAFCGERLAGFKVPKTIEIVDALPRNASGKLLRRNLSQPHSRGLTP